MNLVETFADQVALRPQATAIIERRQGQDRTSTFTDLDLSSKKIAALLRHCGIKGNDVVLLFQPMSADLYAVLLALFRLGAVAMFLDPSTGRDHIEHCCELQRPRALIASPKAHLLRLVSSSLRRIPLKFVFGSRLPRTIPLSEA